MNPPHAWRPYSELRIDFLVGNENMGWVGFDEGRWYVFTQTPFIHACGSYATKWGGMSALLRTRGRS